MFINLIIKDVLRQLIDYYEITGKQTKDLVVVLAFVSDYFGKIRKETIDVIKPSINRKTYNIITEIIDTGKEPGLMITLRQDKRIKLFIKLQQIKGVGSHIAKKMILDFGITKFNEIESKYTLNRIQKLGLDNFNDLNERFNRDIADFYISGFKRAFKNSKFEIIPTGSYRRGEKRLNDLDLLFISDYPMTDHKLRRFINTVTNRFDYTDVLRIGNHTGSFVINNSIDKKVRQIDVKFTITRSKPFALLHFTGNSVFNRKIRELCVKRKLKLNEYGLYNKVTGKQIRGLKTEEDIFMYLGLKYLTPEQRTFRESDKM